MKSFKKSLSLLLAFLMAGTLLSSCGGNAGKSGPAPEDGGKEPSGEQKPVTLSVWIHEGYVNNLKRWGVDPISAWITEQSGITLDISTGDGSNDTTKLNLMISSDSLPDMINVPKMDPNSFTLQNEGLVEDIEELAKQYSASTILKMIDQCNDINLKYNRWKDGNYWGGTDAPLYVWPDYFVDKFTYEKARLNQIQERKAWLVRQDIYEAEGSPDLSNLEDFVSFLEKCKTYQDLNGNPVTPLGILNASNANEPMQILYSAFSGRADEYVFGADGSVLPNYVTPAYQETMTFLNRMYRGGLLDQEVYTETYDQWKDKLKTGNIGVVPVWYWHADGANDTLKSKNADLYYQAIPADKAPKPETVEKPVLNFGWGIGVGFGWRCNYISKACKDKEAAIRFLDFMSRHETQMTTWYGMPGEFFEPAEAWEEESVPKLQDGSMVIQKTAAWQEAKDKFAADMGKETGADNFWGFWCNQGYTEFTGQSGGATSDNPITVWNREQVNALAEYDLDLCKKGDVASLANADSKNQAIVDNLNRLKEKWYPKIVMAASEEESKKAYGDMMSEMKSAGLNTLIESYEKIYNERMRPLIEE